MGAYPRIHDRGIPSDRWLADCVATYVQRDVRQVLKVGDLMNFTTFLRLCAGSTGQELNLSRLGADAGISQPTAKAWLSVMERETHPLRGPIFETWVASEVMKMHLHQGLEASAFHYREVAGSEVDLVLHDSDRTRLVEFKSG